MIAVLIAIESTRGTLISATLAVGERSCRRALFFCASFALLDGRYSGLASGYSEIQSVSRSFLNIQRHTEPKHRGAGAKSLLTTKLNGSVSSS